MHAVRMVWQLQRHTHGTGRQIKFVSNATHAWVDYGHVCAMEATEVLHRVWRGRGDKPGDLDDYFVRERQ